MRVGSRLRGEDLEAGRGCIREYGRARREGGLFSITRGGQSQLWRIRMIKSPTQDRDNHVTHTCHAHPPLPLTGTVCLSGALRSAILTVSPSHPFNERTHGGQLDHFSNVRYQTTISRLPGNPALDNCGIGTADHPPSPSRATEPLNLSTCPDHQT